MTNKPLSYEEFRAALGLPDTEMTAISYDLYKLEAPNEEKEERIQDDDKWIMQSK